MNQQKLFVVFTQLITCYIGALIASQMKDQKTHSLWQQCLIMAVWFDSVCFWHRVSSFSTDDDNDTEVEAIDVDTELSLVTECWVEPQSGAVCSSLEQQRHFHQLTYQEIPQAVSDIIMTATENKLNLNYAYQVMVPILQNLGLDSSQ